MLLTGRFCIAPLLPRPLLTPQAQAWACSVAHRVALQGPFQATAFARAAAALQAGLSSRAGRPA